MIRFGFLIIRTLPTYTGVMKGDGVFGAQVPVTVKVARVAKAKLQHGHLNFTQSSRHDSLVLVGIDRAPAHGPTVGQIEIFQGLRGADTAHAGVTAAKVDWLIQSKEGNVESICAVIVVLVNNYLGKREIND